MSETSPGATKKLAAMAPPLTRAEVGHVDDVINGALQRKKLEPASGLPKTPHTLSREEKEHARAVAQNEASRVDAVVRGQLADKNMQSVVPPAVPKPEEDRSSKLWTAAAEKVQARIAVDEELEKRHLKPIDESGKQ